MNDITIRFLDTYEYLKTQKIVQTPKKFANEINVSTSLITEICKKRTNAGITPIQNLLNRFIDIDANWLLTGKGDMLKRGEIIIVPELNNNYKELSEARLQIIEMKDEKIIRLEKELSELKYTQKESFLYKNVAEPASELKEKEVK